MLRALYVLLPFFSRYLSDLACNDRRLTDDVQERACGIAVGGPHTGGRGSDRDDRNRGRGVEGAEQGVSMPNQVEDGSKYQKRRESQVESVRPYEVIKYVAVRPSNTSDLIPAPGMYMNSVLG